MEEPQHCAVCKEPLKEGASVGINGVTFCTTTDCIEKGVKMALDPVIDAFAGTRKDNDGDE